MGRANKKVDGATDGVKSSKTVKHPPAPWLKLEGVPVGIGGDSQDVNGKIIPEATACLLYTSDAADE